jgi:triphosphoribosyl-dephospho-CoA synthase
MHRAPAAIATLQALVAEAVLRACRLDILVLKPGNVSLDSPGHGMDAGDFLRSASVVAPVMAEPGLTVGERILRAVTRTREAVGCNTNLGIVLLAAPLAQAALQPDSTSLRERVARVLERLTQEDSEMAYRAIRLASPAGLGRVAHDDVSHTPAKPLQAIMREVRDRDRIAWQYAHDFEDVFDFGLDRLRLARERWDSEHWAALSVYLGFLARFPDTHIQRKHGRETAMVVTRQAALLDEDYLHCPAPEALLPRLWRFDSELKSRGHNPGTSADLTVATLLAAYLEALTMDPDALQTSSPTRSREMREHTGLRHRVPLMTGQSHKT